MLLTFARQSKASQDALGYSGERLVNLFLRPADSEVSKGALLGRGGAVSHVSLGTSAVRAVANLNGTLYAIAGGTVYKITGGTATSVGSVLDRADTRVATSGSEMAIVAGGKYYICDGSTTTEYSTDALTNPSDVTFQDGYFIVSGTVSDRADAITVSGLDDGTTFNALDFAFAENSPDGLRGIINDHGELWLFGSRTIEVFYNSGNIDFPFQRNQGALIEQGCHDGRTIAKADNRVFWVDDRKRVQTAAGSSPQIISTREIEEELIASTITGGFTFFDRGHEFYAVTRQAKTTLVYDISTGLWHERSTGVGNGPWICTEAVTVGGTEYFATSEGDVATLDANTFTDLGTTIRAEAVSVPVEFGGNWQNIAKVHMNVRTGGVSLSRAPKVTMETTQNGHTWSLTQERELANLGGYYRAATWHGLGAFQRFQARFRITDPVSRDIYGATLG